jgi:UDP-glucose 4-epimerase
VSVVLVTGGAGYVGSHAVKALAEAGYDVVVYDDLSAGHAEAIARIASAVPGRSVTLVEGDVLDTARVRGALQSSGATAVMHFAAKLLVGESVREPYKYYRTNVAGTLTCWKPWPRAR